MLLQGTVVLLFRYFYLYFNFTYVVGCLMLSEVRRGQLTCWTWRYKQLSPSIQVLETEQESSGRALHACNHFHFFSTSLLKIFFRTVIFITKWKKLTIPKCFILSQILAILIQYKMVELWFWNKISSCLSRTPPCTHANFISMKVLEL